MKKSFFIMNGVILILSFIYIVFGLRQAIAAAIDLVEPQHARNYFTSSGYEADTV